MLTLTLDYTAFGIVKTALNRPFDNAEMHGPAGVVTICEWVVNNGSVRHADILQIALCHISLLLIFHQLPYQ